MRVRSAFMGFASRYISLMFNPLMACTYLFLGMVAGHRDWLGLLALMWAFFVLLPVIILVAGIHRGTWSDFDVSRLAERRTYMPWVLLSSTVGTAVAWLAPYPLMLRFVISGIWLWLLITTIIGMAWKISIHMGANAGVIWLVAVMFGAATAYALVWVPVIVAWARVYGRHHTVTQVLAGAAAGTVAVWAVAKAMGIGMI